ncbi:hypothetical protein NDU88_000778 [Pleurodeles waltl]|uniref:G-protein coupled receptors family 1 profile domain-containing protein n=1 Tax=Pleurodeles waltl TaxID=8319 RepID=A0AAV7P4V3_PLEWA|nr:hypothetical protein NDU88_000778 [Pleurodeles waltl]
MDALPEAGGDIITDHGGLHAISSVLGLAAMAPSLAICLLTGMGWLFLLHRHPLFARKARFLLLACTTLSHVVYFSAILLRFSLLHTETSVSRPLCAGILLLQNYGLFVELAAMDAMCLDRYLAVCRPQSYASVFAEENVHKALLLVFLVPLMPPVVVALVQIFEGSNRQGSILCHMDSLDTSTLMTYSRFAMTLAIILPSVAAISLFYALVLRQGLISDTIVPSSVQARRILLVHLAQTGFYLLPILPFVLLGPLHNLGLGREWMVSTARTTLLIFFTVGQVMGPIVHGLRSKEIHSCVMHHLGWERGVVVPLTI